MRKGFQKNIEFFFVENLPLGILYLFNLKRNSKSKFKTFSIRSIFFLIKHFAKLVFSAQVVSNISLCLRLQFSFEVSQE